MAKEAIFIRTLRTAFVLSATAFTLLVIYLIALMLINYASRTSYTDNAIWSFSAEDIVQVIIKHPGENGDSLTFENIAQPGWALVSPPDIPYDQALAEGLPLSLSYITTEKEIAVNPSSFSDYGLDEPIVVGVFTRDGDEHKLLLGSKSSSGTSRYFSLDGVTVYTMDEEKARAIDLDSLNIRDKNVLNLNRTLRPKDIAEKITRLRFLEGEKLILEAERSVDGIWQNDGKLLTNEQTEMATSLADVLARLIANEFIGDGNLENYQLDIPQYIIEFENENGTQTLLLGKLTADSGLFYACVSGCNTIFTVPRQGFTFLK